MVVQEHPAWPRIVYDLQPVDEMLTEYLNKISPLDPATFDANEMQVVNAYALGQKGYVKREGLALDEEEYHTVRRSVYDKVGERSSPLVLYRACSSGLVEYDDAPDQLDGYLGAYPAVVLKGYAAGYSSPEIRDLLPEAGNRAVTNQTRKINRYFDTDTILGSIMRAFEHGLFARDV